MKKPEIEPVGLKQYMLIRVGMNVGEDEWFERKFPRQPDTEKREVEAESIDRNGHLKREKSDGHADRKADSWCSRWVHIRQMFHPVKAWREEKERRIEEARRRAREQEQKRLMEEQEAWRHGVERDMEVLFAEMMELAEEPREYACVYDDSVRKFLVGRDMGMELLLQERLEQYRYRGNVLPSAWHRCFEVGEFRGYCQQFWVEELLVQAKWPHFVILGTAPCIFAILEAHVDRMKSLRWIIAEKDSSEELLTFVEDFYTEYGLAIALQVLTTSVTLRRLQVTCDLPANILDFTGEPHIGIGEVAEGSVWLDMLSLEEKRRRIAGRISGITYFSLKERWKTAQRRCKPPILP